MNLQNDNIKLKCLICDKVYSSKSSLCHHNKKFHKTILEKPAEIQLEINNIIGKSYKCEYCNKIFATRQSKSAHKKNICRNYNKSINDIKIELLEKENKEIKHQNELITNSLNELKELFLKKCKIHPKTLQKINKNLINKTINNTTNITTNNNIINNTIINKTYVNFTDSINYKLLSDKEILNILNRQWKSLEESIKTIHFNEKYPEFKNIFITNLKDNNAYIFDGTKFSVITKNEALNDLINSHMDEIESSAKMFENKINENKYKRLNKFIETIGDNDTKFIPEGYNKIYSNYRVFKNDIIKNLIYNNSDSKLFDKLKNIKLEKKFIKYNYIESENE